MSDRPRIGLDNPAFQGRLRQPRASSPVVRPFATTLAVTEGVRQAPRPRPAAVMAPRQAAPITRPQQLLFEPESEPEQLAEFNQTNQTLPTETPPAPLRQFGSLQSPGVQKQAVTPVLATSPPDKQQLSSARPKLPSVNLRLTKLPLHPNIGQYSKPQLAVLGMAGVIFVVGLTVSLQTLLTNHAATAQVAALSKKVDQQAGGTADSDVPSVIKPTPQAVSQYVVAPDLARYLKIPKLGVNARVLQVGVKTDGSLGTPSNVYDAAWYTGSAKPGQPGATLLDGHVSSWTAHGVFYGLKKLVAGDRIQIVRGDGTVLDYQVVKTQAYDADHVDMQAAITPVTPGKSGLNLITCTGKVIKGTSEFNQRLIVFATQV